MDILPIILLIISGLIELVIGAFVTMYSEWKSWYQYLTIAMGILVTLLGVGWICLRNNHSNQFSLKLCQTALTILMLIACIGTLTNQADLLVSICAYLLYHYPEQSAEYIADYGANLINYIGIVQAIAVLFSYIASCLFYNSKQTLDQS